MLADNKSLAEKHRGHALTGDWKDHRDCHIKPDLILINRRPDDEALQLVRLGSHSELPRGDVPQLLGASDRHARRITAALIGRGVIVSRSTRAPLRIAFPARLASRWMPGLFPEQ